MKTARTQILRCACIGVVVLAICGGAAPRRGLADPPMYEPYGAWRGRIRYVEGPRRTKTHIRWGNGITPVGGQVLMHLATVAGNVATDENFLNAVAPGIKSAELDAELVSTVSGLDAKNKQLLDRLNLLRKQPNINLPALAFPVDTQPVTGTNVVQDSSGLTALLSEKEGYQLSFDKFRPDLVSQIHNAAAMISTVVDGNQDQAKKLAALQAFRDKSFMAGINPPTPPRPPTTGPGFDQSIKDINDLKKSMLEVLAQLVDVNERIIKADPTSDAERVKELRAEIDELKQFQSELQGLNL
jgi:hypothetical protein